MGSEWKIVRLGDHVDACLGKMLDKNKNQGILHPYLGNKDVRWGSFHLSNLSQMKFLEQEHERYGLRFGDLIVCEGGEPGRCAIWKDEIPGMKIQKALHRIRPHRGLNSTFLHYWFCYAGKFELLDPYFTGTTIKHLTGKALSELPIPLPPLPEQKATAHILGSLDDKIELNRRMNETLEGMAQALFKSWFVDFDPVLDNALAAGNPIPEELAERAEVRRQALANGSANREAAKAFPAVFQFTEELGWIPEGWEVGEFGRIAQNIRISADPKALAEDTPYVGLEHIDRKVFSLTRWGYASDVDSQKSQFESNDFLFGKLRPYFHKVCQVQTGGICSTDILVIRAKENVYGGFVGCQIFEPQFVEYANLRSTGTRMPRASWKDMAKYDLVLPTFQLIETFNNLIQPLREKCKRTVDESLTLTKLRDALLPKLISGELRIPDAEKLAEEALT
ncbi:MAG: restriction endonuclease subunit S [bacterium]|nr:restriction endonuclease subunit S [bacterium]